LPLAAALDEFSRDGRVGGNVAKVQGDTGGLGKTQHLSAILKGRSVVEGGHKLLGGWPRRSRGRRPGLRRGARRLKDQIRAHENNDEGESEQCLRISHTPQV